MEIPVHRRSTEFRCSIIFPIHPLPPKSDQRAGVFDGVTSCRQRRSGGVSDPNRRQHHDAKATRRAASIDGQIRLLPRRQRGKPTSSDAAFSIVLPDPTSGWRRRGNGDSGQRSTTPWQRRITTDGGSMVAASGNSRGDDERAASSTADGPTPSRQKTHLSTGELQATTDGRQRCGQAKFMPINWGRHSTKKHQAIELFSHGGKRKAFGQSGGDGPNGLKQARRAQ
ncbi:hypothetical protein ACLOJK_010961 [Asimina triloba]